MNTYRAVSEVNESKSPTGISSKELSLRTLRKEKEKIKIKERGHLYRILDGSILPSLGGEKGDEKSATYKVVKAVNESNIPAGTVPRKFFLSSLRITT